MANTKTQRKAADAQDQKAMNKHRVMEEERLKAEQKIKIKKIAFNNNSLFCRCIYTYVYAYIHLHTYAPCKDM